MPAETSRPAPGGPAEETAADEQWGRGPGPERPPVEVRRSSRRRRTVSAYREAGRTVVLLPARMSAQEEQRWVRVMLDRLAAKDAKEQLSDDELHRRAVRLADRYLAGRARPVSVRWVTNQNSRWGSCTPAEGTIRISHRLRGMPGYVLDYVILHELAHLLASGHGADFWELLDSYPRTERARGYLEGVAASGVPPHPGREDGHPDDGHPDDGRPEEGRPDDSPQPCRSTG